MPIVLSRTMHLVNKTSEKDGYLRELIKFAKPVGVHNFTIEFRPNRWWHGKARRGANLIKIWVQRMKYDVKYPYIVPANRGEGYLDCLVNSREEMLLHMIAHELRHLWQRKDGKKGTKKGPYRRCSKKSREHDADTYAIQIVEEWRKKREEPQLNVPQ